MTTQQAKTSGNDTATLAEVVKTALPLLMSRETDFRRLDTYYSPHYQNLGSGQTRGLKSASLLQACTLQILRTDGLRHDEVSGVDVYLDSQADWMVVDHRSPNPGNAHWTLDEFYVKRFSNGYDADSMRFQGSGINRVAVIGELIDYINSRLPEDANFVRDQQPVESVSAELTRAITRSVELMVCEQQRVLDHIHSLISEPNNTDTPSG